MDDKISGGHIPLNGDIAAIAKHLMDDDTAYEDEKGANEQAWKIMNALRAAGYRIEHAASLFAREDAATAEIATLRSQAETLRACKAMCDKLFEHFFTDGSMEFDYSDFSDWGVQCGLLVEAVYDPDNPEHVEIGSHFEYEPQKGDIFYRRASSVLNKHKGT